MSEGLVDPMWTDETEDWPKRSWDFHHDDGSPIDALSDVADQMGVTREVAAGLLLNEEFGKAAPPSVIEEARAYVAG